MTPLCRVIAIQHSEGCRPASSQSALQEDAVDALEGGGADGGVGGALGEGREREEEEV